MGVQLPLFPLGTVLFPGLVLPLHIFEPRYRTLVHDLLAGSADQREFGVVAIRRGTEAHGELGAPDLYEIGCTAQVQQVNRLPDGRYDLVTVGRRRFAITAVETGTAPYLTAQVRWLDESPGNPGTVDRLVPAVLELFQRYLRTLRPGIPGEQLPDDPTVLSNLIAATVALPLDDRQSLLAIGDTAARLRAERSLLTREVTLLEQIRAVPASLTDFAETFSTN